jgi:Na+/proline symporter
VIFSLRYLNQRTGRNAMNFLATQPLWISAVILLVPTTLLAMAGPILVRRFFDFKQLRTNNEVAGFKFATVGVLYAVLLAFAVIVVWEKFNQAESDVAKEAGAAATVYRLIRGIDPEHAAAIRKATTDYLNSAIASDWPAMANGKQSRATTEALNEVYHATLKFHSFGGDEGLILAEILRQIDQISEARRERLVMADGIVPTVIWLVLFGGAFLTVGFTLFFATENLRAQVLMTGALSVLIFAGLLTVVAIAHPFAGTVKVGPEALASVVNDFADPPPVRR